MKLCPFCAEEIQDAAIRCKHCRSDLVAPEGSATATNPHRAVPSASSRRARQVLAGGVALAALVLLAPLLSRTVVTHPAGARPAADGCEPSSWAEWHEAIRSQCLEPRYVCEHLTTTQLLRDPDAVHSFGKIGSRVPDVVGRMRQAYGCSPEPGPAVHPEPGPFVPPAFPPSQDEPRSI